jgi:hypothetical protein
VFRDIRAGDGCSVALAPLRDGMPRSFNRLVLDDLERTEPFTSGDKLGAAI